MPETGSCRDDSDCTSATASTLANRGSYNATPLALRSDGRPVFIDSGSGLGMSLGICNSADCTAVDSVPLGFSYGVRTLQLDATDRPVFEVVSGSLARLVRCVDPSCSDMAVDVLLSDTDSTTSYVGNTALDGSAAAVVALEEYSQGDVYLVLPNPQRPDPIFHNGFED